MSLADEDRAPVSGDHPLLAPPPDFRYVGLEPGPGPHPGLWASFLAVGTTLGAGVLHEMGLRAAIVAVLGAGASALVMRSFGGPRVVARARRAMGSAPFLGRSDAVAMAVVPWGILVQPDVAPRVLRWAAVKQVSVEMIHGRDGGSTTTRWSVVTIETEHERLSGRAAGAVSLERLIAHVGAYAEEQAHDVALDVEGRTIADGAFEPVVETLLSAARASLAFVGPDSTRLRLPPSGYRRTGAASAETVAVLRALLSERAPRQADPRALAAVLAAELGATELKPELVALVQSPHPVLAAVAKAAAQKLGALASKVGSVSEVAPFLDERDVDALAAWTA